MKRIIPTLLLALPALTTLPVAAQDQRPLSDADAAAAAAFFNRAGTVRVTGPSTLPPVSVLDGDLASLGGPLEIAGTVRGDVLVINGDLVLAPEAVITGSATVVGGAVRGDVATVAGGIVVHPEPLRFRRDGDRITPLGVDDASWLSTGWQFDRGRIDLEAAVEGSYNRVEGLPIRFGPRIEAGRSNPTVLDVRLIYRTRSGLRIHPDEFGHEIRLEQSLFGHGAVRVGAGLHRLIDPIQRMGISDTENSLSTFILHRDYRDHYARRGWSAYVRYDARTRPLDLGLEYTDESHGSVPPRSPWSLLDNDEPWRPQPEVAEGTLTTLRSWLAWDTRNDPVDPATGWWVRVDAEQGLEGDLRLRLPSEPPGSAEEPAVAAEFTSIHVDVRRYLRLGPRTRLALRAMAAGSPDDGSLPPQRQHRLGGEGTLPGYERFAFDCGAADGAPDGAEFVPYYGCDRIVLVQAEARFALLPSGGFSPGRSLGLDFELVTSPELVLFFDGGRAWVETESLRGRLPGLTEFRYDAGLGVRLGRIGLYLAAPVSSDRGGLNIFIRLGPRL